MIYRPRGETPLTQVCFKIPLELKKRIKLAAKSLHGGNQSLFVEQAILEKLKRDFK